MSEQLGFGFGDEITTAKFSDDGNYRYELTRRWSADPAERLLEWVMLNPSTADANTDDPTIRRCIGFAKAWGFSGIRVTNLFAIRSTDPDYLLQAGDPIGAENEDYLAVEHGPLTVCAWGSHKALTACGPHPTWNALANRSALMCLGYNKDGQPKHPLYVAASQGVKPWPEPRAHSAER